MKYVKNYSTIAQATADTTAVSPLLAFCSENAQVFNLMVGGIDTPLEISAQNGVISVQEKPVGPPNDEIWYTSSDGNIVTPYSTSALPTIVSNTYVDGKGVIKFKTDVTSIGNSAFSDRTNLTSVTIPNSVINIKYEAFKGCTGLTSIAIPNSVTSIGIWAFNDCTNLTSVMIGSGVTNIAKDSFLSCKQLTTIIVAADNLNYCSDDNVLFNKDKTALILCSKDKHGVYSIPNSVTSIEYGAFAYCTSLTSMIIPNNVTSIGINAFYGCTGLTSVMIGNGVTSIGNYAFGSCAGLTSVMIGDGVTSIGEYAFDSCRSLISLTCEATTPPTCGTSVFQYANKIKIYVPSQSVDAYKVAKYWTMYKSVIYAIQ